MNMKTKPIGLSGPKNDLGFLTVKNALERDYPELDLKFSHEGEADIVISEHPLSYKELTTVDLAQISPKQASAVTENSPLQKYITPEELMISLSTLTGPFHILGFAPDRDRNRSLNNFHLNSTQETNQIVMAVTLALIEKGLHHGR